MPNHRIDHWQGIHLQRYGKRWNISIHIHLEPASSMHRNIYDQQHIRNMLAEGHIPDQQHSPRL